MRNFVQPGDVLTAIAPAGGVESGMGYILGAFFVVAATTAAEDEEFEGQLTGVFDLPKADGDAWDYGDLIYWDPTPGEATTTSAAGSRLIGAASAPEGEGADDAIGRVRLDGVARAVVAGP